MNNIHRFMQMAGISDQNAFYQMFPDEESFFKKYPQARQQNGWANNQSQGSNYQNNFSTQWSDLPAETKANATQGLNEMTGGSGAAQALNVIGAVNDAVKPIQSKVSAIKSGLQQGLMSFMNVLPETTPDKNPFRKAVDNPNAFGTGSQAIYANGGDIGGKPTQIQNNGSWFDLNNLPKYNKIQNLNEYADGGQINDVHDLQIYAGGNAETLGQNPYTGDTILFNGASHADGGIKIAYNGNPVEVQGGEPAFTDREGSLVVLGGMKVPGMNKTFQSIGKEIGKEEAKANRLLEKSKKITPEKIYDKYTNLQASTSNIIQEAANLRLKQAATKKENLAAIQNNILDYAEETGQKPKNVAKNFAKKGIKISYDDGLSWMENKPIDLLSQETPVIRPILEEPKKAPYVNPIFINHDEVHDIMGNKYHIPNLPNHWNSRQIDAYLSQNPIDGISSYNQYREYMEDGGEIPMAEDGFKSWIAERESRGNYKAENPNSTAVGKYQFLWGLRPGKGWQDQIKKVTGVKTKEEFLNNSDAQEKFMDVYEQSTLNPGLKELEPLNKDGYSEKQLKGLIHFKGVAGAKRWLNKKEDRTSKYNRPISEYIGKPEKLEADNYSEFQKLSPIIPTGKVPDSSELELSDFRGKDFKTYATQTEANASFRKPKQLLPEEQKPSLADSNKLRLWDFLGDIPALFDTPDYVQGQQYNPRLYQPYQISMQDRLNENNSSFRSVAQQLTNNPEALSSLAAQKYQADNAVLAEQFRVNQGITNDVYNKNIDVMNNADIKNIELSDLQYQRQTMAKSNTKARRQAALNDIQSKVAQNQRDNNDIRLYESMSKYRMNPNGNMDNYNTANFYSNQGPQAIAPNKEQEIAMNWFLKNKN